MNCCEKTLIGICLQESSIEDAITCGVSVESFCLEVAKEAWRAMLDLREQKRTIDLPSVGALILSASGDLWLAEALIDAPVGSAAHWANEVAASAWARETAAAVSRLAMDIAKRRPFESNEGYRSSLLSLQERADKYSSITMQTRSMGVVIQELLANLDNSTSNCVLSGFKIIDKTYGGFMPPDLWIIAARPSMGKTTFAVNCAANAASLGKFPVYFTAEMRDTQIILKEISRISRIPLTKIRSQEMTTAEIDRFVSATQGLVSTNLSVNYAAARKIESIENETRRLHRQKRCDIVFIDYLQLVHAAGKWSSRHEEIAHITGRLKSMAIDLNIPVIACAQVNRDLDKTGRKPNWRGMLTMLKDSGSIEQDADVVMFIDGEDKAAEIDLIFAKVRFGERNKTKCASNLAINSFSDANYRIEET